MDLAVQVKAHCACCWLKTRFSAIGFWRDLSRVGLAALHHGVDLESEDALVPLATHLDVQFIAEGDLVKVILEGEDVSRELRKEETGMAAKNVAALPRVREALLRRQRAFANGIGLVADGRDKGTVVFQRRKLNFP